MSNQDDCGIYRRGSKCVSQRFIIAVELKERKHWHTDEDAEDDNK